jgi:hypothetical protein
LHSELPLPVDSQSDNAISIRLASEDFDDAAQYQLSIYRADKKLWTTGAVAVTGGHDSNKMGRLKMNQSIPWQLVKFHVDADVSHFDRIDVEFLNDGATNSADRNLFVDQVVFKGERFSAENGQQQSKCPPKRSEHAGRLYCNGTLMLPRAHAISAGVPAVLSHGKRFNAEAVYVKPVNKNTSSHLDFALTNVALNNRQWHTVGFRVVNSAEKNKKPKSKNPKSNKPKSNKGKQRTNVGGPIYAEEPTYALTLHSFSCWPDCVEPWPECASTSRAEPDRRSLSFPLSGGWKKKHCHYQSLNDSDKALIDALRYNLEDIYKRATASIPAKRQDVIESASRWSDTIDNSSLKYRQAHKKAGKTTPPLLSLKPATNTDPFVEATFMTDTPLAGQLNSDQLTQNWIELTTTQPETTLATVLLATAPLTATDTLSLPEVLSDLSAQLQ